MLPFNHVVFPLLKITFIFSSSSSSVFAINNAGFLPSFVSLSLMSFLHVFLALFFLLSPPYMRSPARLWLSFRHCPAARHVTPYTLITKLVTNEVGGGIAVIISL